MKTLEEVLWKNNKNDGSILEIGGESEIGRMQVTCSQIASCCGGKGGCGPEILATLGGGNLHCGG